MRAEQGKHPASGNIFLLARREVSKIVPPVSLSDSDKGMLGLPFLLLPLAGRCVGLIGVPPLPLAASIDNTALGK